MKWPSSLTLIRHDVSVYNDTKRQKEADSVYQKFLAAFANNPEAAETIKLAKLVWKKFKLGCSDYETPLDSSEGAQAVITGQFLKKSFDPPDVIFVSPYYRTILTLRKMIEGWPELADVKCYKDERIREQEHGLVNLYNDWKIFAAFHPEQRLLKEQEGSYWYRFPQGENVPDVRLRNRSWIETLIREFSEKNVLAITHHLDILAIRANLERLTTEEFIRLDKEEKPINCGVTLYRGNPRLGKNGRLELVFYNKQYY